MVKNVFIPGKILTAGEYADALRVLQDAGDLLAPAGIRVFVEEVPCYCRADCGGGVAEAAVAAKVLLVWRSIGERPADRLTEGPILV